MPFTVVFDACCLYPAPLRDLLMQVAVIDIVRARWTEKIHDEWTSNLLINRPTLDKAKIERVRQLMNSHVRDCLITDYEQLIPCVSLPDENDRHVLAAAIKGRADAIVTFNIKDFPPTCLTQFGIEILHPDEFLVDLIDLSFDKFCLAVKRHRDSLKKPAKTPSEYLDTILKQGLPGTYSKLCLCLNVI